MKMRIGVFKVPDPAGKEVIRLYCGRISVWNWLLARNRFLTYAFASEEGFLEISLN